ncbi:MAG TPA: polysaccharide biosynthesis tyrosine autokinase [Terrimicrobiaceae bacterium]
MIQPEEATQAELIRRLTPTKESFDYRRVLTLLRSKAWLIATLAAVVFAAALAYVSRAPKIYESRAVIQVLQQPQKVVNIKEVSEEDPQESDYLNSVVHAFSSRKLMLRVIKAAGISESASFAPPKDGASDSEIEQADRLLAKIKISLRRGTRLIDVIVFDQDPATARRLATILVDEFLKESFEQRQALLRKADTFLREEADSLKGKLELAERKLQSYRERTKSVSLDERQDVIVEKLLEVNTAVTAAKNARLRLEADLEQLKRVDRKDTEALLRIGSVNKIPQIALIQEQLLVAENTFATLKERYLPMHPEYIEAKTKVLDLRRTLATTLGKAGDLLRQEYEAARESERKLDDTLLEQEQKALQLNSIAIPYNVLQREVESDRALFHDITQRLKETQIAGAVDIPLFRIIEEPLLPKNPSRPRTKLILALAGVLGLALGLGAVVALDIIDGSLRSVDEAESYLELPVLAAIPRGPKAAPVTAARKRKGGLFGRRVSSANGAGETDEENNTDQFAATTQPNPAQAEAFRTLRASIAILNHTAALRSVLFTSAIPSEGKTFTSLNFASSLARDGRRTLIIDADLRERTLSKLLLQHDNGDSAGLTDLMLGEGAPDRFLRKTSQRDLLFLPAGRPVEDPTELLEAQGFSSLLDRLKLQVDRVIIDSPPVNAVSDALLIAALAQTTCLVIRAGKTPRRAVLRALHHLQMANANVVGMVFNRLPHRGRAAGYYYYQYGKPYQLANGRHLATLAGNGARGHLAS